MQESRLRAAIRHRQWHVIRGATASYVTHLASTFCLPLDYPIPEDHFATEVQDEQVLGVVLQGVRKPWWRRAFQELRDFVNEKVLDSHFRNLGRDNAMCHVLYLLADRAIALRNVSMLRQIVESLPAMRLKHYYFMAGVAGAVLRNCIHHSDELLALTLVDSIYSQVVNMGRPRPEFWMSGRHMTPIHYAARVDAALVMDYLLRWHAGRGVLYAERAMQNAVMHGSCGAVAMLLYPYHGVPWVHSVTREHWLVHHKAGLVSSSGGWPLPFRRLATLLADHCSTTVDVLEADHGPKPAADVPWWRDLVSRKRRELAQWSSLRRGWVFAVVGNNA